MISKDIKFETGFGKSGKEYGDIQASGDIRNILSALITYFKEINPNGHVDSHHGCDIRLLDYDMKIKYGQFGGMNIKKADNNFLGLVFDGGHHWYGHISKHGTSSSRERFLTMENKTGIKKILTDILGDNAIKDSWNDECENTSFSVVLNLNVNWTEHPHGSKEFKEETTFMVEKLNALAKSFKALAY